MGVGALHVVCAGLLAVSLFQSVNPIYGYLHEFFVRVCALHDDDVSHHIWPVYSYTSALALVPLMYVSEYGAGYAPVIVVGVLLRLAMALAHEFARPSALYPHQIALAMFGIAVACKVSFSAYLYAILPASMYFQMTGYVRACNLLAHVIGGMVGWVLRDVLHAAWTWFFTVQQASIAIALVSFATVIGFARRLPRRCEHDPAGSLAPRLRSLGELRALLRAIYSSPSVVIWSVWFVVGYAVLELVLLTHVTLFFEIDPNANLNGIIYAVSRLLAAGAALLSGCQSGFINRHPVPIMLCGSVSIAALLVVSGLASTIALAYACLCGICAILEYCMTAATSIIACELPTSVRGFAILFSTLLSLVVQVSLQFICGPVLQLSIHAKYVTLGGTMALLAVVLCHIAVRRRALSTTTDGKTVELELPDRVPSPTSDNTAGNDVL